MTHLFAIPVKGRVLAATEGLIPKDTATFRPSLELTPGPDTPILLGVNGELGRLSQPFLPESGLPPLLGEL